MRKRKDKDFLKLMKIKEINIWVIQNKKLKK